MKYLFVIGVVCLLVMTLQTTGEVGNDGQDIIPAEKTVDVIQATGNDCEIEFDLLWRTEEVTRAGVTYTRAILSNGGVEPGSHGEERPFYQHTLVAQGDVVDLIVEFSDPLVLEARATPSIVAQPIGSDKQVLDPRWTGNAMMETGWTFLHTSRTFVDGEMGSM
jgi:hypothetical protein